MKTRRNSRKNKKSRRGGLFGIGAFKTEWDNKNNCYSIYNDAKRRSQFCTPAYLERYDYHKDGKKDIKPGPYKYKVPQ
jgi:hypothetical protein